MRKIPLQSLDYSSLYISVGKDIIQVWQNLQLFLCLQLFFRRKFRCVFAKIDKNVMATHVMCIMYICLLVL